MMEFRVGQKALSNTLVKAAIAVGVLATPLLAQTNGPASDFFSVSSSTFNNFSTLPLSMIYNVVMNGANACSINGSPGGNQSPELSWTGVPSSTRSFVVTLYDVTAAFTHWGMYNISSQASGLPVNAGVAGSSYGQQIVNDFLIAQYDGPCPPPNYPPDTHEYVLTVYALDEELSLPGSTDFPANAETLYQALIEAGRRGHVRASASLVGFYSTTPAK
jgi:Raf kinase inhibitor-like YbhB/YbcL family protein